MIITINVDDGAENLVEALRDRLVDAAVLLLHEIESGGIDTIGQATAHFEQCAIQFSASSLARIAIANKAMPDDGMICGCENCVEEN